MAAGPRPIRRRCDTVRDESACKPDSVVDDHPSEASRCRRAPATYPRTSREQRSNGPRGQRTGLLGLAPSGVYPAAPVTWDAGGLLHHRFTLTRPGPGGLFSVALSRGSPRVGVTHHPALRSPDFPQPGSPGRDHPADSSSGILAAHRGESPALLKIDATSGSSTVTPVSSELPSPYRDHRRNLMSQPGITAQSLRCEPGSGRIPRISAPHPPGPCGRRQDPKL